MLLKTDEIYKEYWETGIYKCRKCDSPLFSSEDKFNSITRWPAFRKPLKRAVEEKPDNSFFMKRTEVICKRCKQHLGHVYDDGFESGDTHPEAGKRYCILSKALKFGKK